MPIHHRNVSIVNFMWGQKVVPDGWLPAADRLELRHLGYQHRFVQKTMTVQEIHTSVRKENAYFHHYYFSL